MFPISYPQIWEMCEKAEASFWMAEEVDLSQDFPHWNDVLTSDERHFITHVLAFFTPSDGIVLENLAGRFMREVQPPETRAFYGFQIAIENIHSEMYSLLLETYINETYIENIPGSPRLLLGMNASLMSQYVEFVADHLLKALGYSKMFNWMELVSLQRKANVLEKRHGDYQKASVISSLNGEGAVNRQFRLDEDF